MSVIDAVSAKCLRSRLASYAVATAAAAALISIQSCAKEQPTPEPTGGSLRQSVATQKGLNRYFHDVVVPKMETCWKDVEGKGTIEMRYSYVKDAKGAWAFQELEVGATSLPEGQDAIALACMQGAVRDTSFPVEPGDDQEAYFISWQWPVPLPADAAERAKAMFLDNGGGGSGCDGEGTPASCWLAQAGAPTHQSLRSAPRSAWVIKHARSFTIRIPSLTVRRKTSALPEDLSGSREEPISFDAARPRGVKGNDDRSANQLTQD